MRQTTLFAAALAAGLAIAAGPAAAQSSQPLRCGLDGTFAPHAMPKLGGGVEGFNVELFQEVARRMKREIVIDSASFSGLIPALNAGRYDFLCAPTTVSKERAENLLFTEGYLYTFYQFVVKKDGAKIAALGDLKGKKVSVNKGSIYDTWANQHKDQYGFEVLAFDTQTDAIQAVMAGRADANLGGNTVTAWAVKRNPQLALALPVTDTRAHWGAPFRKDSAAMRNQVEEVIECMKKDGTVAKLYEKWFGVAPAADDAARVTFPGYGVPGMPGYDPKPHEPKCG